MSVLEGLAVYPWQAVPVSDDGPFPRQRFVISAPDLNSPAQTVPYAADYTMFAPGLYNVALFPLVWEGEAARFQNMLCAETSSRVNFKAIVRCCTRIVCDELISSDPCSVVCIRGEYTRQEYRQKKNFGLSRKTAIYLHTIKASIGTSPVWVAQFTDRNLLLMYHRENTQALSEIAEKFEEFSRSRER